MKIFYKIFYFHKYVYGKEFDLLYIGLYFFLSIWDYQKFLFVVKTFEKPQQNIHRIKIFACLTIIFEYFYVYKVMWSCTKSCKKYFFVVKIKINLYIRNLGEPKTKYHKNK